jgi:hypothetical protein
LADSVPGWQTVRSFDHPATCAPQRGREWAIGRASPDGLGNARVSPECSGHPHDRRCLGRQARFGLVLASGQEPATLPVSVLGLEPEAVDSSFVPAAARGLAQAGAASSGPFGRVKTAAASSAPFDQVKTVAAFSDPLDLAKAVADSRSVRMIGLGDPTVDPVIVGPT